MRVRFWKSSEEKSELRRRNAKKCWKCNVSSRAYISSGGKKGQISDIFPLSLLWDWKLKDVNKLRNKTIQTSLDRGQVWSEKVTDFNSLIIGHFVGMKHFLWGMLGEEVKPTKLEKPTHCDTGFSYGNWSSFEQRLNLGWRRQKARFWSAQNM